MLSKPRRKSSITLYFFGLAVPLRGRLALLTEPGFGTSFSGLSCPPFGAQFEKIHDSLKLLGIFDFRHGSCNMRVITIGKQRRG